MNTSIAPLPHKRVIHLLLMAALYFCAAAFLMQFPRYILQIGGSAQDAGWLLALGLIPALLMGGMVGDWNRRIGGRVPAALGCALVVASTLAMLAVEHLGVGMVAIRMLYAVGHSMVFVTLFSQAAFMVDHPVQRAKVIGWLAIAVQLGNALGGTLGELAYLRGIQNYWLESAAIASLALIMAAFLPVGLRIPVAPVVSGDSARIAWPVEVWSIAAVGMAFAGLAQFLPTFIDHLGRTGQLEETFVAAWFITPALLVVAAVRLVGGIFAAKLLKPWVLGVCHSLLVATLILVPWLQTREQAIGLALMFGLGYGWLYPALCALAFEGKTPEARGKVAGWLVAAFEVGFRLSPVGLGLMITYFGYHAMFLSLAAAYGLLVLLARGKARIARANGRLATAGT